MNSLFSKLEDRQKEAIIIIDEVYLKKALLYHGGQVFGKSVNNPGELATSMLGIMVKCLFGGPTFLLKMIPVTKVDSQFIHNQLQDTIDIIRRAGGKEVLSQLYVTETELIRNYLNCSQQSLENHG